MRCAAAAAVIRDGSFARTASKIGSTHPACTVIPERAREILGSASGLRLVEVPHQGNTNASPEEAREVARLTEQLTGRTWRDKNGTERSMEPTDILIITPYNAQIRCSFRPADTTRMPATTRPANVRLLELSGGCAVGAR